MARPRSAKWTLGTPEHNKYLREHHRRRRAAALELLGGCCARCGFTDSRALQIDHVHNDGYADRKRWSAGTAHLRIVASILAGTDTGRYQVLCANCNWIKKAERYIP